MIRMHNLPENIKESLKPYYKTTETPDVFPSRFRVNDRIYYYFTFAPAAEQLIMTEKGEVPRLEEVKRESLIFNSYNVSIETVAKIGSKWAKSGTKENYQKLLVFLQEMETKLRPLPHDIQSHVTEYKRAANIIIQQQELIESAVKNAGELWDYTNKTELATDDDQRQMRGYIVQMCKAAYRQNEIQLQTEQARNNIWEFVSSKRWPLNVSAWGIYLKLQAYQKNMMKNTKENVKQMQDLNMVTKDDLPLEHHNNANEVIRKLRNPR